MRINTTRAQVRSKTRIDLATGRFTRWQATVLSIIVFGMSLAVADAEPKKKSFSIEAQPAKQSLTLYARQAQVQLGFAADVVTDDIVTNAVIGEYDVTQALELLLKNTGLQAEYGERGIIIRRFSTPQRAGGVDEPPTPVAETTRLELPRTSTLATVQSSTTQAFDSGGGKSEESRAELDEIIVTGSQIRGAGAAGANVIELDREYIKLSGFSTTQEVLQSIPQNFATGANELTEVYGVGFNSNSGFGSSVNLRGLGTESTLILVNGRRVAPGGGFGNFVDPNSIPASAIERIDVLPDGASAIYGSDAIAGVINIILRDDFEGAETSLRYAPGLNDIDETQVSQVLGTRWGRGNVMLTFDYYDRSALKSEDRSYTRDSDLTSLGGNNYSQIISNPGNILDPTQFVFFADAVFAIPENQNGTALSPTDLIDLSVNPDAVNLQNTREGTTVLPEQRRYGASLLMSQELTDKIDLFADVLYSSREYENRTILPQSRFISGTVLTVPSSNPFFVDPFGGSSQISVAYSFVDDYGPPRTSGSVDTMGATLGSTFELNRTWALEIYGSYNREETDALNDRVPNTALLQAALADPNPATAFNPFGDGSHTNPATLAAIEGFTNPRKKSELSVFNAQIDGDLFDLPGGPAKLAIGAQHRDQSLEHRGSAFARTLEPVPSAWHLERDVTAAFAEAYLPIVTSKNGRPGMRSLAVSIAARYEDYSDFGDTIDPKLGVAWSPTEDLVLRSTFGTSFRAPLLTELDPAGQTFQTIAALPDPASPTGTSTVLLKNGTSPDLISEEGTTWTVGLDIEPAAMRGLKVGLTYFSTEIEQLIARPAQTITQYLQNPQNFAPVIQRVPDDVDLATVETFYNEPSCFCFIPADEIDVVIDNRLNNLNKSEVSGLDVDVAYAFNTESGSLNFWLYASHLFDFKTQRFAGGPLEEQLDTLFNPNSLRIRGGLTWNRGAVRAAITGDFVGDYTADAGACGDSVEGFCPVSSWTTWNLNLGYDFDERYSGFLAGTNVSLNVRNVFDRDPPFVEIPVGAAFDPVNANPWGSFLSFQVTKTW